MVGGELRPLFPGRPWRISGVFKSTMPLSPNARLACRSSRRGRRACRRSCRRRSAAASARRRASTRRRASRACRTGAGTPRLPCPWSRRARRPGYKASAMYITPLTTRGVFSLRRSRSRRARVRVRRAGRRRVAGRRLGPGARRPHVIHPGPSVGRHSLV